MFKRKTEQPARASRAQDVAEEPDGKYASSEVAAITGVTLVHLKTLTKGRTWTYADFDMCETVGTGTFARVRMVKLKDSVDRTPFVLKIMKKVEIIRLKQVEHVKAEKQILSMIEHPFIVNLLSTFQHEKHLYMLMEFVNGGELFAHLRKVGRLENDHARFYAGLVVLALQYLHSLMVVYRDIKPENVLIDFQGHIKITDFGFAKIVEDKTFTLCGTPEYLAPEMVQAKGHNKGVDWWALGVLMFEMLAGYPPFTAENPYGIYQKVLKGEVVFPRHFDVKVKELIKRLLVLDRGKRFGCLKSGAEDVKKHKWFKVVDWDIMLNRGLVPPFIPAVKSIDDTCMFDKFPDSKGPHGVVAAIHARDQVLFELFSAEAGT